MMSLWASVQNGSILHQVSSWLFLAGLALCCFSILGVLYVALTRERKTITASSKPTESAWIVMPVKSEIHGLRWLVAKLNSKLSITRTPTDKGYIKLYTAFVSILVISWTISAYIAITDHHEIKSQQAEIAALRLRLQRYDNETVQEDNVTFLAQLPDGEFAYKSDQHPEGDTFRVCASDVKNGVDTAGILGQAIGYTAHYIRYEERGTCKSILRKDLEIKFRDEATNFRYRKAR